MPFSDQEVMEGATAAGDEYRSPPSLARSAADWATSAIRGLARGAVGMVGQFGDIPQAITEVGYELGVPRPPPGGIQAFPSGSPFPTTQELTEKIGGKGDQKNAVGKFLTAEPETTGGKYAQSVGEFAAPSALGRGRLVGKALEAVGGGLGSEAAGELFSDHPALARVIGGALGSKTATGAPRAITPFPTSAERQAAVQTLRNEGVEPTAGDVSGSKTLKHAESVLGDAPGAGSAYGATRERQGRQFTRAVLSRVGENADLADADTVNRAFTRIGNNFDALAARNHAQMDPIYFNRLYAAQDEYHHLFVDPLRRGLANDVIDHAVNQLIRSPRLEGEQYQALRSRLERTRRDQKNKDPEMANFLSEVRDSLDDLMERSIRRNNPQDLGAWQEARRQYRNMTVIEKAATGAGEHAAEGIITPAKLRQALVAQSRRGYARGRGDFADLARAGEFVMKPPSSSNTAERAFLHAVPTAILGGIGAGLAGHPITGAAVAAAPWIPGLSGRVLMNPRVQRALGNQIFGAPITPNTIEALAKSFAASKAAEAQ